MPSHKHTLTTRLDHCVTQWHSDKVLQSRSHRITT